MHWSHCSLALSHRYHFYSIMCLVSMPLFLSVQRQQQQQTTSSSTPASTSSTSSASTSATTSSSGQSGNPEITDEMFAHLTHGICEYVARAARGQQPQETMADFLNNLSQTYSIPQGEGTTKQLGDHFLNSSRPCTTLICQATHICIANPSIFFTSGRDLYNNARSRSVVFNITIRMQRNFFFTLIKILVKWSVHFSDYMAAVLLWPWAIRPQWFPDMLFMLLGGILKAWWPLLLTWMNLNPSMDK